VAHTHAETYDARGQIETGIKWLKNSLLIGNEILSMERLAYHLDQMRLGLVYTGEEKVKSLRGAKFVIEDMSRDAAEVFSKLNLDKYIPA